MSRGGLSAGMVMSRALKFVGKSGPHHPIDTAFSSQEYCSSSLLDTLPHLGRTPTVLFEVSQW